MSVSVCLVFSGGHSMFKDFVNFLKLYGIVGLAIAVIIGGKLNLLVSSLVQDIVTPIILQPALKAAGVENVAKLTYHGIFYGKFLGSLIDFTVVAFLIYLFAKKVLHEETVAKK
jgi:large conductance mechanosensitive channel